MSPAPDPTADEPDPAYASQDFIEIDTEVPHDQGVHDVESRLQEIATLERPHTRCVDNGQRAVDQGWRRRPGALGDLRRFKPSSIHGA